MTSHTVLATLVAFVCLLIHKVVISSLFLSPLSRIPGPKLYALSKWRLALEDWRGTRTRTICRLHKIYGPVVRVGPNEISFNSLSALRTIYGAGSGFERTSFYDMFDVYGKKNLFTFYSVKDHAERKKLLAHAYSKSVMIKGSEAAMIQAKVKDYMDLIERDPECAEEIFSSLHYFSIDAITDFLYGEFGKTACLRGNNAHRALLADIMDVARRKLSWFAVHFPAFTKWLYTRSRSMERLVRHLYPMQKPTTYTGIRAHALQAWKSFQASSDEAKANPAAQNSIIGRAWKHHKSQKQGGLGDLDVASECADHLLAGIDTTSDSLMFLIWALSRPQNLRYQERLKQEIRALPSSKFDVNGIASVETCDKLQYLDAVIKETLRLYAPLPASEPRSFPQDITIDGYLIPARTVVSMSPFNLHRNAEVFKDPLVFDPERWLGEEKEVSEMRKWFWAFSSGGRMCIGLHLAMAEMTTLVVAVYKKYSTSLKSGFEDIAPGVTSRFEVFHDDTLEHIAEHECYINFQSV